MNWEMIGAIGEVGGAIAVVVTLAYLARQLRSSARATQLAVESDMSGGYRAFVAQVVADPELSRLLRIGMPGNEPLSADEGQRFGLLLYQLTLEWQREYYYMKRGDVRDSWFNFTNDVGRRELAGTLGYRRWFETRKHWLSAEFRSVLESEVQRESGYHAIGDALAPPE